MGKYRHSKFSEKKEIESTAKYQFAQMDRPNIIYLLW